MNTLRSLSGPIAEQKETSNMRKLVRSDVLIRLAGLAALGICAILFSAGVFHDHVGAQTQTAPKFKVDMSWPKTLPNKWKMGGVTGLAVDADDNVWVYDRPNDLTTIELEAELNPPIADCCIHPPSMIHIAGHDGPGYKDGEVIGSFDAPQGHGMAVDKQGFVYLGQNTVRKYDPKTGKMLMAVPHVPDTPDGKPFTEPTLPKRKPGEGSAGPVAGFIVVPGAPERARGEAANTAAQLQQTACIAK